MNNYHKSICMCSATSMSYIFYGNVLYYFQHAKPMKLMKPIIAVHTLRLGFCLFIINFYSWPFVCCPIPSSEPITISLLLFSDGVC